MLQYHFFCLLTFQKYKIQIIYKNPHSFYYWILASNKNFTTQFSYLVMIMLFLLIVLQ